MNNKKPKHKHPPTHLPADEPPSFFSNTVLFGMTAMLGGLLGYAGWQYYNDRQLTEPPVAENVPVTNPPVTPAAPTTTPTVQAAKPAGPVTPQTLRANWMRSDGGYVLAITKVADDGKLQAAYLNPNPINVEKAETTTVEGQLRVFVVLRDVNYPGSTYDLRYDAVNDQLVGEYFQAGQQQRFQVAFERVK